MTLVKDNLMSLGYHKLKHNTWVNNHRVVVVQRSKEFNKDIMRIRWKEEWKEYHAMIFDYSPADGGIYVVPREVFFNSYFVDQKRKGIAYRNSGFWWSQVFPANHELAKLVLKHKDRWDIISNYHSISDFSDEAPQTIEEISPKSSVEVLIDGSNVAFDNVPKDDSPRLQNILLALDYYKGKNLDCRVIVDASFRWKIDDKEAFQKALDDKLFYQSPSGVSADEYILRLASFYSDAMIVSNDDFKSWRTKSIAVIQRVLDQRERFVKFKINGGFIEFR